MIGPLLIVTGFAIWNAHERIVGDAYRRRARAYDLPKEPSFKSYDASVVICTVNPNEDLARALRLWYNCRPREIIIVTIDRDLAATKALVLDAGVYDMVEVKTVAKADHRAQQSLGIKTATGEIIIMADDDAFVRHPSCIEYLLAPFEDKDVGAVNNMQLPDMLPGSQNSMNFWECISARALDLCNEQTLTRYGADGVMWSLIGRTMAFRAELIQDPAFIEAFNKETFLGVRIKTGSDNFFASWIRRQGRKIVLQYNEKADITTTTIKDSSLIGQKIRWQRNAYQVFFRTLTYQPGFRAMLRENPYMARKMLERVFRPVLLAIHLFAIIRLVQQSPAFMNTMVAMYALLWYEGFKSTTGTKYPGVLKLATACMFWEWFGLHLIDVYACLTIFREGWMNRDDDAGESSQLQQPSRAVVEEVKEKIREAKEELSKMVQEKNELKASKEAEESEEAKIPEVTESKKDA